MASKRTEKEVNFALAKLLRSKHPRWRGRLLAERTDVFENRGLAPDIFLRRRRTLGSVVVETEFEPGRTVEEDARARLGQRFSESGSVVEQVVAAKLPRGLRTGGGPLEESLGESSFRYCVWSGTPSDALRWPKRGWLSGGIDDLARCVELCASSERLLSKGLEVMENAIRWSAAEVKAEAESLRSGKDLDSALGAALRQKGGIQTRRMAMAIVLNAMAFHAALAEVHAQVRGIESLRDAEEPRGLDAWTVMREWTRIVKNINYYPIFSVAIKILEILPRGLASRVLEQHAGAARKLARLEVTAVHDLSGRAFQRLISDRRFLATFYTLPTSAQLLAELAVQRMDFDWSDLKSYPRLRVADLACGTGTLLSAAYSAILSRYRRAGGDDMDIHREMVENAMIAADIMPAGVHLAASQISSAHPRIGFSRTRFYTMRFGRGGEGPGRGTGGLSLGSLDLIDQQRAGSLFGTGHEEVHGGGRRETKSVRVPHGGMDLVIMNPPFTRPTNHERAPTDDSGEVMPVPSFAGFSNSREDQKAMSARLKKLRRALSQPAGNGYAGLASDFIDLAHKKIKLGQPIAFVLPFSVVRGKSWGGSRRLLSSRYENIAIISIAASGYGNQAFSADTGIAEVLLLANRRKTPRPAGAASPTVLYVNLRRRPRSAMEAAEVASAISRMGPARRGAPPESLYLGDEAWGSVIHAPLEDGGCAGVREAELARAMLRLRSSELVLPRLASPIPLRMTTLDDLGNLGLVDRSIGSRTKDPPSVQGPFWIAEGSEAASYPALWAHEAARERMIEVWPDSKGIVREDGPRPAGLRDMREWAESVWSTATRLHYNRDFRLNSQSLAACLTPERTLGGTAWPNFAARDARWDAPLALWSNTTLGCMLFWWRGMRTQQGRARITVSALKHLPALDVRELSDGQLQLAAELLDRFSRRPLLPANEAYRDPKRKALDRAVLIELLGLPKSVLGPLDRLALQWCLEPSVHGGKSTRPKTREAEAAA